MTLKTPTFWYREKNSKAPLKEMLLTPASYIYGFFFNIHQGIKRAYKAPMPVLCIGNIVAGGTGKTPTSIALMRTLKSRGLAKNPFFLIRGYGGAELGPTLVDLDEHTAWEVGDEALILAKHAPTIVGGDRAASAKLAQEHGADMLVMDDGLQNPGIHKDLKLVVINGDMGFGNKKLMPAGPLRQPLEKGANAADGFILIGKDARKAEGMIPAGKPLLRANLKPGADFKPDTSKPYIAFAGLGYPEKFFKFLKKTIGLNVIDTEAYGDHHPYNVQDLQDLHNRTVRRGATLITTEKDFMRLPEVKNLKVETVPVDMVWDDEDALVDLIKASI